MKQNYFIGIDVSKEKLDVAVINSNLELVTEKVITNSLAKINSFFSMLIRKLKVSKDQVLVCCENTGIYGRPLEVCCVKLGINLWVEHPLKVKKASTDMRGKSDQKDAYRIAEYAFRYSDKCVLFQESTDEIKELRTLLHAREDLIEKRTMFKNQLRESQSHNKEQYLVLKSYYGPLIKALNKQLVVVEKRIDVLTEQDPAIRKNVELITSIDGIGKQNALQFIMHTDNFHKFTSANQLACYAGVVPFPNQSGTITKRERISKHANKTLKKLLHMAAMAAVRFNQELKEYYIRKVKEGKNKMSVLNAVRNKLVHRIYSVINRQTPFVASREKFLSI